MIAQDPHRRSVPTLSAILQTTRIRRRIQTSDAVAALLAELAFGPACESWIWHVTAPATEAR